MVVVPNDIQTEASEDFGLHILEAFVLSFRVEISLAFEEYIVACPVVRFAVGYFEDSPEVGIVHGKTDEEACGAVQRVELLDIPPVVRVGIHLVVLFFAEHRHGSVDALFVLRDESMHMIDGESLLGSVVVEDGVVRCILLIQICFQNIVEVVGDDFRNTSGLDQFCQSGNERRLGLVVKALVQRVMQDVGEFFRRKIRTAVILVIGLDEPAEHDG